MNHYNFFENTPVFEHFNQVVEGDLYMPLPDDWWIIVGDIRNSTPAIEQGKYKEVNMAGATIIAAISNLFKDVTSLPFTFGGDGAFVAIPDIRTDKVEKTLEYCRMSVHESFNLDLKVGMVPINDIRKAGYDLKVARLRLSETIHQALFWGEGLEYAESIIKKQTKNVDIGNYRADLDGLECRWQEIPPEHDEITSVIIKAADLPDKDKTEIYENCLRKIDEIYTSLKNRNPVQPKKLHFSKSVRKLAIEWKIRTWKPTLKRRIQYALKLGFQIITGKYLMYRKIVTKNTDWGRYKSDLIKHADYRKFGNDLKFIVSGTMAQKEKLQNFLESEYKKRNLYYGIHSSGGLIITCYVTNYHKKHMHFVDGSEGGYAMASKMLKKQLKQYFNDV